MSVFGSGARATQSSCDCWCICTTYNKNVCLKQQPRPTIPTPGCIRPALPC